ncbi:MAG: hypothetical protein LBL80_01385 [Ruminococcus sp.]|jgi:stress response protein SCP2|nr:hypothetical protein [Ruminococcus sp.]
MEIQEMIDAGINIPAGEYEGPFLINRPSVTDGGGSVLYIRDTSTAALNISSGKVTVKNISLEAASPNSPALLMSSDTMLENVFVYGSVIGNVSEEGFFDIPYALDIGGVPADEPFEFTIKINVPAACDIIAERGAAVSVSKLTPGINTLGIRLPGAKAGSVIRRSIYIKTAVYRKMIFTAKALTEVPLKGYAPLLFEPEGIQPVLPDLLNTATVVNKINNNDNLVQKVSEQISSSVQKVTAFPRKNVGSGITSILPKPPVLGKTVITRGMHYPLRPDDYLEIEFMTDSNADAYVFLHDGSMIMRDSRNLIFFGNDCAVNNSISYLHTNLRRAVYIDLQKLNNTIGEIDVVYASYDNTLIKGTVIIKTRGETISIPTDGSSSVITAFQITTNSPGFVLTPLIMPYRRGIAELIRSYGLEVK